ncbi:MAG: HDOD domain-containing protein [Acidobacteria bacterium]|nr:MAG: HDOD domain-containing protein [Acidobacteriota bacterium]
MSESASLLELIEARIGSGAVTLPPMDDTALRLREIANRENVEIGEIVELIESDQALAAEVLRVANSSLYGGLTEVATTRAAIVRIGMSEVVRLAIMASEKGRYQMRDRELHAYMAPLWQHAAAAAQASRWLASRLGYAAEENEAFLAGLLHDIGKLLIFCALDEIKRAGELGVPLTDALLTELLDAQHAAMGHRLVSSWQLPSVYAEVIRDHHAPTVDPSHTVLLLVRLADHACVRLGVGLRHDPSINLEATPEADALGATPIMLAEMEVMLEEKLELAGTV